MNREKDDRVRKLHAVMRELGWEADIDSLIARFRQVDDGISHEDEFIYLLNWTGRCKLFHKLDQSLLPPFLPKHEYVIPDLLVELANNGKSQPFLIEIKTSSKAKLDFTPAYYGGLQRYSQLLNIPILIAWKSAVMDAWTLVELRKFVKAKSNYKLTFERALQESVFPSSVGDYCIIPNNEFGFGMKFRKLDKIDEVGNSATWQMIVDDVYFIGKGFTKVESTDDNIFKVLLAFGPEQRNQETKNYLVNEYLVEPNSVLFAQSVLLRLVKSSSDGTVNWIQQIKENRYPIGYFDLRKSLEAAIGMKLIHQILDIVPPGNNFDNLPHS